MNIEKIAEIIYEELSYMYCDNCRYATEITEHPDRIFSPCDECYRKYNNWGISMKEAKRIANMIDTAEKEKEKIINKPIRIDGFTEKCPKCGEKVMYAVGTGVMFHGASESYEDWRVIKHDYCPKCGTKIDREGVGDE